MTDKNITFYDIKKIKGSKKFSLVTQIFLENILRKQGNTSSEIEILLSKNYNQEFHFYPSRILMQDFTGVPAVVDLATMRDFAQDPLKINPQIPVDLVVDHSLTVDFQGSSSSFLKNIEKEYERNKERYSFLKWAQKSFTNFRLVPPGTGICHQVNLEFLAHGLMKDKDSFFFETILGTDSHTTMINGLGILGWGVGGIEAESAMLGQGITLTPPKVLGVKIIGTLSKDVFATDLVLTLTEALRKKNVVGSFVEYFGPGVKDLSVPNRATIANMAPEYGATCGLFPIDKKTFEYLELTNRDYKDLERYVLAQDYYSSDESYEDILEFDLSKIRPCLSGPKRPQDKILLEEMPSQAKNMYPESTQKHLENGSIVLAAITSCTNTSNPEVMIGAGLFAKKAYEAGLRMNPKIKTSFAPGSKVVYEYLCQSGLQKYLDLLGFQLVGYGCTTCIGNSGPLQESIEDEILEKKLDVAAVLSGNRNFEGRIHPLISLNYLASPILVVAYALAESIFVDFYKEKIQDKSFFIDLFPTKQEIESIMNQFINKKLFKDKYSDVFLGDDLWQNLNIEEGVHYPWNKNSSYIQQAPFLEIQPIKVQDLKVLALLGDSVTTDHISPAGSIPEHTPAGFYLKSLGIEKKDFNSYGARRGNHSVMVRGTFANIKLRNEMVLKEGGWTLFNGEEISIYDASLKYNNFLIIAGKEYGTGSSRDWAAKGPKLLGVKIVLAESFERIHRSNLIGMGILPLEFLEGDNRKSLNFSGKEIFNIQGDIFPRSIITLKYTTGSLESFVKVLVRIETHKEFSYYESGGILPYMLTNT